MVDITDNRELCKKIMQDLQIRYPVNAPVPSKKGYIDDDEDEWRNSSLLNIAFWIWFLKLFENIIIIFIIYTYIIQILQI